MAATEVQGANMEFLVRDFGSADTFVELVCQESLFLDITNAVNTTLTNCGPFKGIQSADFKTNGTAVANVTPTGSEYSYDALQLDQIGVQKKEFIMRNKAFGTFAAGEAIRMSGGIYFVSSNLDGTNGQVLKFTWAGEGVGTLNTTES